ncbi:MAG: tetratricopeptide repeat protein [Bacillota bacterium]
MRRKLVVIILIMFLLNVGVSFGLSRYEAEWENILQKRQAKLQNEKKDYISRYELAVAHSNLGEIKKATKLFKGLKKVENRDKKLEEIIKMYQRDLDKDPNKIETINFLAFAHFTADNYKRSRKLFKKIVELDSENIWSYNYLAVTQHELKNYSEAKKTLEKSLELEKNEYTHFLLGANYYKQGNLFKAFYHIGKGRKAANFFLED